jgi:outer membrane protein assembly factor BamE (lipoprotein component of BamABCDE complex)
MKVRALAALAILLWCGGCVAPLKETPEAQHQAKSRKDFFTVGSDMDEVASIMGTPVTIMHFLDDTWWYYGTSRIVFRNGRVIEWDNSENNLKVRWNASTPDVATANTETTAQPSVTVPVATLTDTPPPAPAADASDIDAKVTAILQGEHNPLPPAVLVQSEQTAQIAEIAVKNDTQYTLTVLYSGPSSRRVMVVPKGEQTLGLAVGTYRVAATVDSSSVIPYAGSDDYAGGVYDETFYIETKP